MQTRCIPTNQPTRPAHQQDHLKCLYLNPTSIVNKWDQLNSLIIAKHYPEIIFITETWFKENSINNLNNYTLFSKNRSTSAATLDPGIVSLNLDRGGGVAIYVRDDLQSAEAPGFSSQNCPSEQVWCTIRINKENILLGCLYRPPHSNRNANLILNSSIDKAAEFVNKGTYTGMLIAGDFNHGDIIWESGHGHTINKPRPSSAEFIDTINYNLLHQHVELPTHKSSILDLVITESANRIFSVSTEAPLGYTPNMQLHNTLTWNFTLKQARTHPNKNILLYNKGDYSGMNNFLSSRPLDSLMNSHDINHNYDQFLDTYKECIDTFIPIIHVNQYKPNTKTKPKWFNKEIKALTRAKYRLYWKTICNPDNISYKVEYRMSCRKLKKTIRAARKIFEENIISASKNNPKLLYTYINSQRTALDRIQALTDPQSNSLCSDKNKIANILNNQFFESFSTDPSSNYPRLRIISPVCNVNLDAFSPGHVEKLLLKLDTNKANGTDGIKPRVLKECAPAFSIVLSKIFTKSMQIGQVPLHWKEANITPIHKKGSKLNPANYRPISLTAVPCKIMETIVRNIMMDHLISNNLISSFQHGFVHNKSCHTNLLETLDITTESANKGFPTIIIFLDFAKAFDKVSHTALTTKLHAYGFSGPISNWISDFLTNRKQRVILGDSKSDWLNVLSGTPQGSVLGPLLFTIFINDMPRDLHHHCRLFADDTKLIAPIKNAQDYALLQSDINKLVSWARTWNMSFNIEKCKFMIICKNKLFRNFRIPPNDDLHTILPPLTMENHPGSLAPLLSTSIERDLGIYISDDLKWHHQCMIASNKAYAVLGQLKQCIKTWNVHTFRTLYTTFVRPHLEYAASAWNPYRTKDIKLLEKVQRRATKLVRGFKHLRYAEDASKPLV